MLKMAKILVNLTIPALSESYDLLIPDFLKIRVLMPMVADAVTELSSGQYISSGKESLCCRELSKALDQGSTLRECGITNGDHLYLF